MMVYPVPGRRVRDPVTKQILAAEGLDVSPHDLFWARRLRDEDVSTTAPAAPTEVHAEAKAEAPAAVQPADHREEDDES
ncbi:MAG: DUF2635 domain-containing protein [Paraburkholderia sp.]|uniref:DUF2635 domain-containing protein n=1 Tax=Burkholderiaceae TaxID=119060 RepID=UPI0010FA5C0D|nr:DUF2635 domain-containing protein [Burkholderia sp. 4M9327F10]